MALSPPGANAGRSDSIPPSCPASAEQKQAMIPTDITAAKTIWARQAAERRQHIAAAATIAAEERTMCPRLTSCPATVMWNPKRMRSPNANCETMTSATASIHTIAA